MKIKSLGNRRAQIGDTITWFVATVAVIVILAISILVSSVFFKKDVEVNNIATTDILASKSLFSYALTSDSSSDSGKKVYEQIKEEDDLNKFNGELAKKIFINLLGKDYPYLIWLGFPGQENSYFGSPPNMRIGETASSNPDPYAKATVYATQIEFYKEGGLIRTLDLLLFKK